VQTETTKETKRPKIKKRQNRSAGNNTENEGSNKQQSGRKKSVRPTSVVQLRKGLTLVKQKRQALITKKAVKKSAAPAMI
jgi:hypothetical protein